MTRPRTPLVLWAALAGLAAQPPVAADAGADLYRRVLRGTARVVTPSQGVGTGWVVDRERKRFVTNRHVVGDHKTVEVLFPTCRDGELVTDRAYYREHRKELEQANRIVSGRVVLTSDATDLALVELDGLPADAAALPLAREPAQPGEPVHSVGQRGDLDALWAHTAGSVRQMYRSPDGYFWQSRRLLRGARVVLAQLPVNEGDSGGALVNAQGEVVAVVAAVRWQAPQATVCVAAAEVRALLSAKPVPPPERPSAGRSAYARALRGTAWVQSASTAERGTGWVFDRERKLLVTSLAALAGEDSAEVTFPWVVNGEVVAEPAAYRAQSWWVRLTGRSVRGWVLARDARRDLALLELESLPADALALELAVADPPPGSAVVAIGNPRGLDALWAATTGSVRQVFRKDLAPPPAGSEWPAPAPKVLALQAPLVGGDSGGPVVDERGRLIGVVGSRDGPAQVVHYACPVGEVRAFLSDTRPWWRPRSADEFRRRALLHQHARRWTHAGADFDAALRLAPSAELLSQRSYLATLAGDPPRALADADAAIRQAPKLAEAYAHRAAARLRAGDAVRAVADCDRALWFDPKCALSFAYRAEARRRKGDLKAALAEAEEAVWQGPNLAEAYYYRGLVRRDRGEDAAARGDFGRAIEFGGPLRPAALLRRATALRRLDDPARAAADVTTVVEIATREGASMAEWLRWLVD